MGSEENRFDGLVAVPDGVAKWALIFAPFWLAFHRLWFALAIYALATILIASLLATPLVAIPLLLSGLPGLYLFLEGNQLRRYRLERQGYEMLAVVDAEDKDTAIEKFLHRWQPESVGAKPTVHATKPTIKPAASKPSFGMFAGDEA